MKKYFSTLNFFFKYLRFRMLGLFGLNIFVGLLDAIGLSLFIPMLEFSSGAADGENDTSEMGPLKAIYELFNWFNIELTFASVLVLMVAVFLIKGIFKFLETYYRSILLMRFVTHLRFDMLNKLSNIKFESFLRLDSGRIQNIFSGEVLRVISAYTFYVGTVQYGVMLCVYLTMAFFTDFTFALLVVIGGVLSNFLFKRIFKETKKLSLRNSNNNSQFQSYLIQMVHYFKYLKATNYLKYYKTNLFTNIKEISNVHVRMGFLDGILQGSREPVSILIVATIIYIQVIVFDGYIGAILLSLMFFYRSLGSLLALQASWQSFVSNSGSVTVTQGLIEELNESQETENEILNIDRLDSIKLEKIGFSYQQNSDILKEISLEISAKSMVAFVGKSGSGKTTLVNLIVGLIRPSTGVLKINGINSSDYSLENYRLKVGYITQEPVIFNDTFFNNVTFWDKKSPENLEKFYRILEMTRLNEVLDLMKDGYETNLGDNGILISGGQKQRISIARELYKDVELLVFDEATSALDSETERELHDNIKLLKGKFTILMIAHRLSTVQNSDQIVVLEAGKIVGKGKFSELKENDDKFRRMVDMQALESIE